MAAVAVVTVVEVVMLVDRSGMIVTVVCSITVFVLLRLSGLAYCAPGQIPHLPCSVCLGSLVVQVAAGTRPRSMPDRSSDRHEFLASLGARWVI